MLDSFHLWDFFFGTCWITPPGYRVEGASEEAVGFLFFRIPLRGLCELVEVAMPGGEGPLTSVALAVAAVTPLDFWVEGASEEAVELLFFRIPLMGLCELVEVAMPGGEGPFLLYVLAVAAAHSTACADNSSNSPNAQKPQSHTASQRTPRAMSQGPRGIVAAM